MKISTKQFLDFLSFKEIEFDHSISTQGSFTVASIFEPIKKGFYFFAGDTIPLEIEDSLLVVSNRCKSGNASNSLVKLTNYDPQLAFYEFLNVIVKKPNASISERSIISRGAVIGKNVLIEDFCVIGNCEIGENTIIRSNTKIHDGVQISENCVLEAGCIIGAEGVAWIWNSDESKRIRQPQLGGVKVGKNCFLGANTIVVRGSLNEKTSIGRDTIMAPGCRIGHGSKIGGFVHFSNSVTLGGNVIIDDNCFVGSGAVIRPKVKILNNTVVGAGAVVVKNSKNQGMMLMGVPAKESEVSKKPSAMPKQKK